MIVLVSFSSYMFFKRLKTVRILSNPAIYIFIGKLWFCGVCVVKSNSLKEFFLFQDI